MKMMLCCGGERHASLSLAACFMYAVLIDLNPRYFHASLS